MRYSKRFYLKIFLGVLMSIEKVFPFQAMETPDQDTLVGNVGVDWMEGKVSKPFSLFEIFSRMERLRKICDERKEKLKWKCFQSGEENLIKTVFLWLSGRKLHRGENLSSLLTMLSVSERLTVSYFVLFLTAKGHQKCILNINPFCLHWKPYSKAKTNIPIISPQSITETSLSSTIRRDQREVSIKRENICYFVRHHVRLRRRMECRSYSYWLDRRL